MGEEIQVFDLHRMFLGEQHWWFTAEVIVRTVLMYLYTLGLVRLLGKREMGQLAPFELVIIIALGSAVGDPMFYPDVPLIHAFAVITVIVGLQHGLVFAAERSNRVERLLESEPARVVCDGRLEMEVVEGEHLAKDELFTALREAGIEQLGQVRLAYLEPTGRLSIYRYDRDDAGPGLSLQPRADQDAPTQLPVGAPTEAAALYACTTCGERYAAPAGAILPECRACSRSEGWVLAVRAIEEGRRAA